MNKPTLYVMCGLPFSGKTTLAKELSEYTKSKILAYDWIWAREKPQDQVPDLDNVEEWNSVLKIALEDTREELRKGNSIVFDHINHTRSDRDNLRKIAEVSEANFVIVYLDVSLEKMDQRRKENLANPTRHHVISVNLEKVYKVWESPLEEDDVVVYKTNEDLNDFLKRLHQLV